MEYNKLPEEETMKKTSESLEKNGFKVYLVENKDKAREKTLELLPIGAEVFTMSSITLEETGIAKEINDSGNYVSVRKRLMSDIGKDEKRKIGTSPNFTVGSAHALTEDGKVIIVSNTGSQLPAYAYGAGKVVFVVGAQKIVKDLDEGLKRISEYVLPLESARANKAYNITTGSNISKMLIINKELQPERISIIIVNEVLGF